MNDAVPAFVPNWFGQANDESLPTSETDGFRS